MQAPLETNSTTSLGRAMTKPSSTHGHRILISIPNGFQLRQVVHSGIVDLLRDKGCRIAIVSPNRRGEGFTAELAPDVDIYPFELSVGPFRRRYLAARQHLLLDCIPTETLRQKMIDLWPRLPSAALFAQMGNRLLRLFPWLRERALRWERFILRDAALDKILASNPVDLIFLGTPGYVPQDALLMHAGAYCQIPVVAAVASWDNLSSKGLINPQPNCLLVWSDHMRREAIKLQGMPAERIVETGSTVHQAFADPDRFGSRQENFRHLGLDPERQLIFYGTNHGGFFPDEVEVVRRVAEWVENDALGKPCQLWVRLHPQAVTGPFQVPTDAYSTLASERVKVEFPPVHESSMLWDLPKDDLDHLVRLLRDADIVINTGSTLSIDAAILDRPVISIAYDPAGNLPYEQSIRRYYDLTHMSTVVTAGATQLATSAEDLRQNIVRYLDHPELDRDGRRRIVEQQLGRVDSRSTERVVEAILKTLHTKHAVGIAKEGHNGRVFSHL